MEPAVVRVKLPIGTKRAMLLRLHRKIGAAQRDSWVTGLLSTTVIS